jgi:molecular chaperone HtpG
LVKYITENKDNENAKTFAKQLYDLAVLANRPLNPTEMQEFVTRSNEIMMLLAK